MTTQVRGCYGETALGRLNRRGGHTIIDRRRSLALVALGDFAEDGSAFFGKRRFGQLAASLGPLMKLLCLDDLL